MHMYTYIAIINRQKRFCKPVIFHSTFAAKNQNMKIVLFINKIVKLPLFTRIPNTLLILRRPKSIKISTLNGLCQLLIIFIHWYRHWFKWNKQRKNASRRDTNKFLYEMWCVHCVMRKGNWTTYCSLHNCSQIKLATIHSNTNIPKDMCGNSCE